MAEDKEQLAVEVSELRKYYGSTKAVDGMTFSVSRGEIFGLLGPNGAGKSTTMEIIIGLRMRDEGKIKVFGMDPQVDIENIKARIGVQLQTVNLFPQLTVKEIITLFASFYKKPLKPEYVISQLKLEEKSNSRVGKLSGGQLQRVAVAAAMVGNGDIIFLDEPTAGLDPQSRRNLWEVIFNLKNAGKTVFITTHFMDEAERLCDRVAIVDHGRIITMDSPKKLIETYFEESAIETMQIVQVEDRMLESVPGVTKVQREGDCITLYTKQISQTVAGLMELANANGIPLNDMRVRQATLEDVFLKITGRRIRE